MLSDYLDLLHLDVNEFTLVMALIAVLYSGASTIMGVLILAIFWDKLDEIQSLLEKKKLGKKKPASSEDDVPAAWEDVLDVLPVDESDVLEPVQTI